MPIRQTKGPKRLARFDASKLADGPRPTVEPDRVSPESGGGVPYVSEAEPSPVAPTPADPAEPPEPTRESPAPAQETPAVIAPDTRQQPSAPRAREAARPKPSQPPLIPDALARRSASDRKAKETATKTRFTPSERQANLELLESINRIAGSKISEAHFTRALWALARRCEDTFTSSPDRVPHLSRPGSADVHGTAQFEEAITDFIHATVKSTRKA